MATHRSNDSETLAPTDGRRRPVNRHKPSSRFLTPQTETPPKILNLFKKTRQQHDQNLPELNNTYKVKNETESPADNQHISPS